MCLSEFQQVTDQLIRDEKDKLGKDEFRAVLALPPNHPKLNVMDNAQISVLKSDICVRHFSRDSSALGHGGYMYRSDDDPVALEREFPHTGYTRVAPHWFFFSE